MSNSKWIEILKDSAARVEVKVWPFAQYKYVMPLIQRHQYRLSPRELSYRSFRIFLVNLRVCRTWS